MKLDYFKKDISLFNKIGGTFFLLMVIISAGVGIFGIVDGIKSQMNGGYGDNIVLGTIIFLLMPLLSFATFLMVTATDEEWREL